MGFSLIPTPQTLVFLITTALTIVCGFILLPALKKHKLRQTIRDDGPQTHLSKMGTPTMGGVVFLIPVTIVTAFILRKYPDIFALILTTLAFGIIGFIDDMLKVRKKSKDGLFAKQKLLLEILVATGFSLYMAVFSEAGTEMIIPFTHMEKVVTLPIQFYIPFIIFVIVAVTNAVNLTDGVDGLASGVTLTVFVFFTVVSMLSMEWEASGIFSAVMAGGCLGFLAFNMHPARMFMGDTGALALGGAVASISIIMRVPWIILFAGLIYVLEALSVVLQVISFKLTGRRIFKMSPIHHHFELSGWKENKIVIVFVISTIIMCLLSFLTLV